LTDCLEIRVRRKKLLEDSRHLIMLFDKNDIKGEVKVTYT